MLRMYKEHTQINGLPGSSAGKEFAAVWETWEDLLEKGMVLHSSILAWSIPWTEVPGVL